MRNDHKRIIIIIIIIQVMNNAMYNVQLQRTVMSWKLVNEQIDSV